MEHACDREGYIIQKYPKISVTAAWDFKCPPYFYTLVCLSAVFEIRISFEKLAGRIIWYAAQHINFTAFVYKELAHVVYSERLRPEMLANHQYFWFF